MEQEQTVLAAVTSGLGRLSRFVLFVPTARRRALRGDPRRRPYRSLRQQWVQTRSFRSVAPNAVKDYLGEQGYSWAIAVIAEGRGETQPVTLSGACNGPRSIKVLECLQPDRRVHAEATGMADLPASSR